MIEQYSAFKDVALQFLGNLYEFFLVKRNQGEIGRHREHLTVIAATSRHMGVAAIDGLKCKKDISGFIMYPEGKVSPVQCAQMTTISDLNGTSCSFNTRCLLFDAPICPYLPF